MLAIILGLLGAALGVGLYRLGFWTARHTPPRPLERAAGGGSVPMTPQELFNFLNYDGGEIPPEKEQGGR